MTVTFDNVNTWLVDTQHNNSTWSRNSSIPVAYQGKLSELEQTPDRVAALAAAARWVVGDLPILTLTGDVGRGKSRVAGAAATVRGYRTAVDWITAPAVANAITASFDDPARRNILAALRRTTALVLDDLDKARQTPVIAEAMFLAIEQRLAHGAPVLITTNLMPSQLRRLIPTPHADAILSRLSLGQIHKIGGPDRRRSTTSRSVVEAPESETGRVAVAR